jgi:beta-lactamase regulating signal transducer with metallopeptidase domain
VFSTLIFFKWLLSTSAMASILAILILVIRKLVKDRVGIRWQNVMWFLLIIKLLLPISPASSISLYNILSYSTSGLIQSDLGVQKIIGSSGETPISQETRTQAYSSNSNNTSNSPGINVDSKADNSDFVQFSFSNFLLFMWLAGLVTLIGYTLFSQRKLIIQIRKQSRCLDKNVLRVFEDCKQIMGVVKSIAVVETSIAQSPTLFGFIRPVMLLPEKFIETLSSQQLRHIFLHELAHVKRNDILVNWLTSLLQILHWFNPILWYAFYKMREDQEIACDELALTCLNSSEVREYAGTIIRLVEVYSAQKTIPGLASVLRKKSEVKRRVIMVKMFGKKSIKWSVLGLTLVITLGVVTLTGAKETMTTANARTASSVGVVTTSVATKYSPQAIQIEPNKLVSKDGWTLSITKVTSLGAAKVEDYGWHSPFKESDAKKSYGIFFTVENANGKDKAFLPKGKVLGVVGVSDKFYEFFKGYDSLDKWYNGEHWYSISKPNSPGVFKFSTMASVNLNEQGINKVIYQDEDGNKFDIQIPISTVSSSTPNHSSTNK